PRSAPATGRRQRAPTASCQTRPAASRRAADRWARARSGRGRERRMPGMPAPSRHGRGRPHLISSVAMPICPVSSTQPTGVRFVFTRIALFLATNLAVLFLASIVMSLLGVSPDQMAGLLVLGAMFGFGGSLVSLLTSKWMAKRATGAHVITQPRSEAERWLVDTVRRQAQAAGIGMPEVAIYDAPEINAFATGANRNNALVAVSTGLLRNMSADEAEAVLGHEIAHVANGDMVTMALLQGVLNTFVIVLARVVGGIVDGYL